MDKKHKNKLKGLLQLLAVLSIAYSTVVIAMTATSVVPLVLVAPQAIWGALVLVNKFAK